MVELGFLLNQMKKSEEMSRCLNEVLTFIHGIQMNQRSQEIASTLFRLEKIVHRTRDHLSDIHDWAERFDLKSVKLIKGR